MRRTTLSPFDFGQYSFGKLNLAEVRRLSKRSKSDYFARYENVLRNRFSVRREFHDVTLINWWPFRNARIRALQTVGWRFDIYTELVQSYFDHLNFSLFEQFFREIHEEQLLTIVLTNAYLDPKAASAGAWNRQACHILQY